MDRLYTIGAYGFEPHAFFEELRRANVDVFLDLRRRRGIRGGAYSFANSHYLQRELGTRGISYRHVIELAPQPETRELQSCEDTKNRVAKRQRSSLGQEFVTDYECRTLQGFDWPRLIDELHIFQRPVLFCVERLPDACHRGLVAARLTNETGVPVTDLMP